MAVVVPLMGTVGPVRNGHEIDVGGPKQQAVLVALALSAGRRISTDRLIDLVWDENPPTSARRTVQSYVAGLRRYWVPARRWNRRRTVTPSISTETRSICWPSRTSIGSAR